MRSPAKDRANIDTEPSLFESLWRHKWVIAGAAVLAMVVGYGVSIMQPRVYQAEGQVLLSDPRGAAVFSDPFTAYIDRGRYVRNEAEVFKSRPVAVRASELLGGDPSPDEIQGVVSAHGEFEFDALTIGATQPTGRGAIDLVNAVVAAYEEVTTDQNEKKATDASTSLKQSKLELQVRIAETEAALAEHPDSAVLAAQSKAQLDQLRSLDVQIEQIATSTALYGSGVRLYDAPRGASLVAPKPMRNAAIAAVLALIAAGAWAWWRDERNDEVDDRNTPAGVLDAPLLGTIPEFSSVEVEGPAPTVTDPDSVAAEAYHFIVSSLKLALDRIGGTIVVVTSTGPNDGKTVTALHLAIAASGGETSPLLIDADERTHGLSDLVKLSNAPGLTNITEQDGDVTDLLRPLGSSTGTKVQFLPAGTSRIVDAARFFRSPPFRRAIQTLVSGRDLVLIDAPPILAVADTTDIAHQADCVLMVVPPGTSRNQLDEARARIEMTGTPIVGYVYNRAADSKDQSYTYPYGTPKTKK